MSWYQVKDEKIGVDIAYFISTEQVCRDVDKQISCFIIRFLDGLGASFMLP